MAHIFKYPENGCKGIIVLTHKEFRNLECPERIKNREMLNFFSLFNKLKERKKIKDVFKSSLSNVRDKYFIGVHWGFFYDNVKTPDWVDFHLCAKGTAKFLGSPYIIPLNSANFTPKIMEEGKQEDKYWDIICVARNSKNKNYEILMKEIRKLYDKGYFYKILFLIATNGNESKKKYYVDIFKDYNNLFDSKEKEIFTIIKTHPDTGFQGLSYTVLSWFYKKSKVFTLFSQKEGQSKVIKEAQLCGLPVVVKSDLIGGGRDYLDKSNSVLFDNFENAHMALISAVENHRDFSINTNALLNEIGETKSIERLKEYFKDLYSKNGMDFDGELINLDNLNVRLPAHYFSSDISWASDEKYKFTTTDIMNSTMLKKFFTALNI